MSPSRVVTSSLLAALLAAAPAFAQNKAAMVKSSTDFLKQAHEKLEQPTTEGPAFQFLQQMTDEALRRIDPSLVAAKAPPLGGPKGGAVTQDEMDRLKRQLEEAVKKQQSKGDKH